MLLFRTWRPSWSRVIHSTPHRIYCRHFTVLGIETSCDDTSVCLLSVKPPKNVDGTHKPNTKATILFHKTITSDNRTYGGIHPVMSLRSHRASLAPLVKSCIESLLQYFPPDLIAVTRGPGITSSVDIGLETAKGLAAAWNKPLIGVHHMQAHALTVRLANALKTKTDKVNSFNLTTDYNHPKFPFLNLLISGGHSLLVLSTSLTSHRIIVKTLNIAVGDAIDKCARSILPKHIINNGATSNSTAYGKLLESFVFSKHKPDYESIRHMVPGGKTGKGAGGRILVPLTGANNPAHGKLLKFSFSSFPSNVDSELVKHPNEYPGEVTGDMTARRSLGLELMTRVFQHLSDRVILGVNQLTAEGIEVNDLVVSGGVASNDYLRWMLQKALLNPTPQVTFVHKQPPIILPPIKLHFPPVELCTDNAAMIAWTGWEMYNAGWETDLNVQPFRKWSLEEKKEGDNDEVHMEKKGEDGWGILTVEGWKRRDGFEMTSVKQEG